MSFLHNSISPRLLQKCMTFLWIAVCLSAAAIVVKKREPVYLEETLNVPSRTYQLSLHSQNTVTQSFTASCSTLQSVEIAFAYPDTISSQTTALVEIFQNGDRIISQPLTVSACPNSAFLPLQINAKQCSGDTFTVKISNTSSIPDDTLFSLLISSETENSHPNIDHCVFQNTVQPYRLQCRITYLEKYQYYAAFSYAFWIFLIGWIIHRFLTHKMISQPQNTDH